MGWESFWNGVAAKCFAAADKADAKLQSRIENATVGQRLGIPRCLFCRDKRRSFTVIRPFAFSVDRLSRARVKGLLQCDNCGMQAVIMRWGDSKKWSWTMAN
jgi:hypothetical protein